MVPISAESTFSTEAGAVPLQFQIMWTRMPMVLLSCPTVMHLPAKMVSTMYIDLLEENFRHFYENRGFN